MAYKSPLINPTPARFVEEEKKEVEQKESYYKPDKDQLRMHIDKPSTQLRQYVSSFGDKLRSRGDILEHSPVWNTQAFAFLITSFLFNIVIMIGTGIFRFSQLPENIPFFFISTENSWVQLDKSFIFFIPVLLFVFLAIQFRFFTYIFDKDRRLALVLLWINALLNVLFAISTIQIYKLVS